MNIGNIVLKKLKQEISNSEWERYIKTLNYDASASRSNLAQFYAPNMLLAKWIKTKYQDKIAHLFEVEVDIRPKVIISVGKVNSLEKNQQRVQAGSEQKNQTKSTILNPSFTFESFIIGDSNQFAYTTAKSVSEKPGALYNPLFLYGGVGLGKTHLIQAIGNHQISMGKKVIYTTFEQFMNKFTSHLRSQTMDRFRDHFRECDVLLIDDIQFLSRKEQTQEEFFHTFNELHQAKKQIVITSDRQPNKIAGLVDRLRSRFEWGLMADIQPPGLETKIAIIQKKCEIDGISLNDEIINFIASNMGNNIREIEGAIIKLNAYSGLMNQKLTLEFAQNVIKDQLAEKQTNITIDDIVKVVSKEQNIKLSDIKSKKRTKDVVAARRISIYLTRNLTPNSMPQIAVYFGMKDHTAVSHAMKKINELVDNDENFKVLLEEFSNKITSAQTK
ncbi:MAG: Chromosomal replication initiator protein DnaA [uncultured Sulfurovum sp.]|uniref:Chromosomal replication initiator protein DnaA n=1 Tax=uncultured Sulfurovum sp. TaxID=269237 RepID=A0A6S6UHX1_9BACT|nr:MAG: Chromosomal replication initiator protein DnaA [uncultured Sulfurovum sp.]